MQTEQLKKLTEQIKNELTERLQMPELKEFIEHTKAADAGNFEVVISTTDLDRQGEIINQDGWNLDFYKTNPVVLWAHDYFSLPIGVTDEIEVKDGRLIARGRFAPEEANPFAQQIRRLYDLKIVRATSVGYIPLEQEGNHILKAELLEFSFVPVPANPFALSLRQIKSFGLDLEMLATKGLKLKVKQDEQDKPKEGDPCELEDGTEGELKPNEAGELVCMPKETTEKVEETEESIRIPVKDPDNYDPDSIRTITISEDEGIQALTACPKGEYSEGKCNVGVEVITYIFDKDKWTIEEAQAWVEEHEKFAGKSAKDIEKVGAELAAMQSEVDNAIVQHARTILEIVREEYREEGGEAEKGTKIGRTLSRKNRELIEQAISQLEQIIAALRELLAAAEPEGGEGEETPKASPKQKSDSARVDELKKLDEFLMTRQLLRSVSTQVSEALERINQKMRQRSRK